MSKFLTIKNVLLQDVGRPTTGSRSLTIASDRTASHNPTGKVDPPTKATPVATPVTTGVVTPYSGLGNERPTLHSLEELISLHTLRVCRLLRTCHDNVPSVEVKVLYPDKNLLFRDGEATSSPRLQWVDGDSPTDHEGVLRRWSPMELSSRTSVGPPRSPSPSLRQTTHRSHYGRTSF